MMKRLPHLKYRIAAFLIVNPFLALTVGAMPLEVPETALSLIQMGIDAIHQVLAVFQPRALVLTR